MRLFSTVFILCLLFPVIIDVHAVCRQSLNASAMDAVYYQKLEGQVGGQNLRLTIMPFADGSASGDSALMHGLPEVLNWYLEAHGIAVVHPFVTKAAVAGLQVSPDDFFDDDKAIEVGEKAGATHVLYGLFQTMPAGELRYFIKIRDIRNKAPVGNILEFVTDLNNSFFSMGMKAASRVASIIGGKRLKSDAKKSLLLSAPSWQAFRYYMKGMIQSSSYSEVDLAVAAVWFEKAVSLDYQFRKAYQERARALMMQALMAKQQGKDASLLILDAQKDMQSAGSAGNRWITGAKYFARAMMAATSGDEASKRLYLEKTVADVPEDALALYYLDPQNELARKMNPCLQ